MLKFFPILLVNGDEIVRASKLLFEIIRPNIRRICENGWSANLRIVVIKLFELTQCASPNLSIYFNFVRCLGSIMIKGEFRAQSSSRDVHEYANRFDAFT